MNTIQIKKSFDAAGLPLKIAATPRDFSRMLVSDTSSFLFDIRKEKKSGKNENKQFFIMFKGNDAIVEIVDIDKDLKQAIMNVSEPKRIIKTQRQFYSQKLRRWVTEDTFTETSGDPRSFLIGHDEHHLFVAQLPASACCVREAHRALKPMNLKNAREKRDFIRQGEWFFVDADPKSNERYDRYVAEWEALSVEKQRMYRAGWIYSMNHKLKALGAAPQNSWQWRFRLDRDCPVGSSGGRPHKGDLVITTPEGTFVKGEVKHPDHKTICFKTWHRVLKNTEVRNNRIKGMRWVD